jgi:hypothetical protein
MSPEAGGGTQDRILIGEIFTSSKCTYLISAIITKRLLNRPEPMAR